MKKQITPTKIYVKQFLAWKNQNVKPIDGINIPNITIPPHLMSKKRPTETVSTVSITIRHIFNSLTSDNIPDVREKLRTIIYTQIKNVEMLREVADEIFHNFIVSEQNIKNYMCLLNAIWNASILVQDSSGKNVSPTIGNLFLNKCKNMIFEFICEDNIRRIASLNTDDNDELDIYNRERDKIINLIITICYLYEQRKTSLIKVTAVQVFSVMEKIMNTYEKLQNKMKELGNPYNDEDCLDENEYEILRKMCTLYAEQIYTFLVREGKEFIADTTNVNGRTLKHLVERFRDEVFTTLTEPYLITKCKMLELL
ncbi:MAG: hypothetical protein QXW79_01340 [Thermoplasmata archaeon]